jgi:hypothetical protein
MKANICLLMTYLGITKDYSARICSSDSIDCVTNVIDVWSDTASTDETEPVTLVDLHYLLSNTREKI